MWFFPVLSILTVAGIGAVLVQMAFDSSLLASQFWLSLLSWAVVVGLYFFTQRSSRTRHRRRRLAPRCATSRLPGFGQQHSLLERQPGEHLDAPLRQRALAACSLLTVCGLATLNVLPCRRIFPPPAALRFFSQSRSGP